MDKIYETEGEQRSNLKGQFVCRLMVVELKYYLFHIMFIDTLIKSTKETQRNIIDNNYDHILMCKVIFRHVTCCLTHKLQSH